MARAPRTPVPPVQPPATQAIPPVPPPAPPAPARAPAPRRRSARRFSAALFWAVAGALAAVFTAMLMGYGIAPVKYTSAKFLNGLREAPPAVHRVAPTAIKAEPAKLAKKATKVVSATPAPQAPTVIYLPPDEPTVRVVINNYSQPAAPQQTLPPTQSVQLPATPVTTPCPANWTCGPGWQFGPAFQEAPIPALPPSNPVTIYRYDPRLGWLACARYQGCTWTWTPSQQ